MVKVPAAPRPYLSTAQLAEVTPWSRAAIEAKVRRGEFRKGVHYFQPHGRDGERIWKWSAVVALIEQEPAANGDGQRSRGALDVEKATAVLRGMLNQSG